MLRSVRRLAPRCGWRAFTAAAGSKGTSAAAVAAAGEVQWSPARAAFARFVGLGLPATILGLVGYAYMYPDDDFYDRPPGSAHQVPSRGETVVNWSATHSAQPKRYYQPETEEDVEAIVADCHQAKRRLRVVGSALSPNGIALSEDGMMSMALLDKIVRVDADQQQVTVQAGCRVQQVADALKPYGLTLQNYASIREQQIGGFTQVSAHGTGATIPPVDEQVVALKLVTPGKGTLTLSKHKQPALFELARVGLGSLGVVTELTLQCKPMHYLVERTFVTDRQEVERNHAKWMRDNQHLKYMWFPYTNRVAVVQCNPATARQAAAATAAKPKCTLDQQLQPLRELLQATPKAPNVSDVQDLSYTQLRDVLLAVDPLDKAWVAKVNAAEAEYWNRSGGLRAGTTDEILGFDCGGQQWVLEVAFPVGSLHSMSAGGGWFSKPQHRDLSYIQQLMQEMEAAAVPLQSPIEQRWTSSSSSPMSPASHTQGTTSSSSSSVSIPRDSIHSWVGIIMYLPTEDPAERAAITNSFMRAARLMEDKLMPAYNASWHWAKIEPDHSNPQRLAAMKQRLAARFPVAAFNAARARLDPHNILANDMVNALFGPPAAAAAATAAA